MVGSLGRRARRYPGERKHKQPVLVGLGVSMPIGGASQRVTQREEIANVDVGANGSRTDRALEQSISGRGDHRMTGLEAVGVPLSSPAAMAAASPLFTLARASTRRSHPVNACAGRDNTRTDFGGCELVDVPVLS